MKKPNFQPPHPDLTPERLTSLATLILDVWNSTVEDHKEEAGDGELVFGVRLFERCLNRIRRAATTAKSDKAWLRSLVDRLHYVFTVGEVPLRFFRGYVRNLKLRYRQRREEEQHAHQIAFQWAERSNEFCFRIVIEETTPKAKATATNHKPQRTARIVLVKYSLSTNEPLDAWDMQTFEQIVVPQQAQIPFEKGPSGTAKKTSRMLPSEVEVKMPRIHVKKPKKGTGDGT